MAITSATIFPVFFSNLSGAGLSGLYLATLSNALADATSKYIKSGIRVVSTDSGLIGAGTGFSTPGAIILPQNLLFNAIYSGMIAQGVDGPVVPSLSNALASSISQIFSMINCGTVSLGIGSGFGVAKLIPTGYYLVLKGMMDSQGVDGPLSNNLALALGTSVDSLIPSVTFNVQIFGSAGVMPITSVSSGYLY